jgi:predicted nucleic acid-binding protein
MPGPIFVDTWGWIALGHRKNPRHYEVKGFYQEMRKEGSRVYTSDYVLDEVVTLLFRREAFDEAVRFMEGIFAAAEQGHLTIERITSERFSAAWRLRRRFKDKTRISFTDLTSMAVMEERGLNDILTEDEHFIQVGMGFQRLP